ncbi:ABC transporter permease [Bosea sp. (in: a-proteobacteria)]|uniref:ABC transporter permease n=1 Tax=Bosea sp. (in: a-proteobacteria) TaxID=1871050 RepID=UPI002610F09D|nr:ABC transporter permease [Bosea sp. (in: a-proteobacteria)]MCO5091857.1 ABC transporter permease [Bosea sp. (in: a-proteobacteria)]
MFRYVLLRLVLLAFTLFGASLLVFAIMQLLPDDAADVMLGMWSDRSGTAIEQLRALTGLDRPWWEQYLSWLGGMLKGDFGRSISFGAPIGPILFDRLGNSMVLAAPAMAIAVFLSLSLAMVSAIRAGSAVDHAISIVVLVIVSMPAFVIGSGLILVFAGWLQWFPSNTATEDRTGLLALMVVLALPVMTLALESLGHITRTARSSLIETMRMGFVSAAELKGLSRLRVLLRHVLPNALLPTITVIAINIGWMLGGVVVVEQIFGYPGIGTLVLYAIEQRDLPLIQSAMFFISAGYCIANLLADFSYMALDPRVRAK